MLGLKVGLLAVALAGSGALGLGAWRVHSWAGQRGHGFHGDGALVHKFVEFAIDQKLEAIGASEAQKQKVREIKQRLVTEGHALHADRAHFREQLLDQLSRDQPDAAQLRALVRERVESFSRLADQASEALLELHSVFTTEQRQQLLAEAREHMRRHHH